MDLSVLVPAHCPLRPCFNNAAFHEYVQTCDAVGHSLPPRQHSKNVLESKHRIVHDIYLRLAADADNVAQNATSGWEMQSCYFQISLTILNNLYGKDLLSANELAKGYTRPINGGAFPSEMPSQIHDAKETLRAKRKLNLILRSKSTQDEHIRAGDLVQIYIKQQHEKRGSWSAPKPVLAFGATSNTVTVPGSEGCTIKAAVEDARFAATNNDLAMAV